MNIWRAIFHSVHVPVCDQYSRQNNFSEQQNSCPRFSGVWKVTKHRWRKRIKHLVSTGPDPRASISVTRLARASFQGQRNPKSWATNNFLEGEAQRTVALVWGLQCWDIGLLLLPRLLGWLHHEAVGASCSKRESHTPHLWLFLFG